MSTDSSEKLRELALSVTRGNLRRPWSVQTSNSFRRIGTDRGDGDVLCAVTQRADGHPDLHAAPDVLDYIVAAHPFVILQMIQERDSARHALYFLRHKIASSDWVFQEAGKMAGICLVRAATGANQDQDHAAALVRAVIADLADRGGLRQAWEEIEEGIRREIVESWEKIARDQLAEGREISETRCSNDAGDSTGNAMLKHPPIASYALGERVTFHPGRGDRWHPGLVTRLESGLRLDGSTWHMIFISSSRDLPTGEWEHAGVYQFEDGDHARVSPAAARSVDLDAARGGVPNKERTYAQGALQHVRNAMIANKHGASVAPALEAAEESLLRLLFSEEEVAEYLRSSGALVYR